MTLVNVTTWSANKMHLMDSDTQPGKGPWGADMFKTLCDAVATQAGGRTALHPAIRQEIIDYLDPCKKCAKKRDAMHLGGDE